MVDDVVVQYNYYHELRGLLQKKTARLGHDGTRQCVKDQFVNLGPLWGVIFLPTYSSLSLALVIGSHPLILQAELQSAAGDSLYFSIQYEYGNQLFK